MKKIDLMPIKWFGDKNAYMKSELKIITVGLNPSDKEFREKKEDNFSTSLRFKEFRGDDKSLELALNNYFEENAYKPWFKSFEPILNGLDSSFYRNENYKSRALHTDICSHWATSPTWSKLKKEEKDEIANYQQWFDLVEELNPDLILISVAMEHIRNNFSETSEIWHSFNETGNGKQRKDVYHVEKLVYNSKGKLIPVAFGRAAQKPYGLISDEQKLELGKVLKNQIIK